MKFTYFFFFVYPVYSTLNYEKVLPECIIIDFKTFNEVINIIFRLKKLFNTIPRFYCSERCKAPNAFYSGAPFLSLPSDGKLKIKETQSKEIEWQIWTSVNTVEDLKVFINHQEIHDTERHAIDGMIFTMKKQDVQFMGKYVKVQANVKIEKNPTAIQWTISVANDIDGEMSMEYLCFIFVNFF